MEKRFLRVDEVARDLDVSPRTIYRLIQDGRLLAFPVRRGNAVRIPRESFDRYVQKQLETYQVENGILVTKDDTDGP